MMKKNKLLQTDIGTDNQDEVIAASASIPVNTANLTGDEVAKLLYQYEARVAELESSNRELKMELDKTVSYINLYDFSPVPFLTISPAGIILQLNHAAGSVLGMDRKILVNQDFRFFLATGSLDAFDGFLRLVFESGSRQTCQVHFNPSTESKEEYRLVGYNYGDETTCRLAIFEEGPAKIADVLIDSEYFSYQTQQAAFIGSYYADFVNDTWDSSDVLNHIFGIDKGFEKTIESWLSIVHPDDRLMMNNYLQNNVIARHEPFRKEYRIVRQSDGVIRWVMGLGQATFDTGGNILKLIGTIQDITERKQTEAALIESETHFRTLADSGQALIWTSDLDQKCNYVNKPWLTFKGRTLEQELGDGWKEGIHPEDVERIIAIAAKSFHKHLRYTVEYRMRNASGEYRWIQDAVSPRFDSIGRFIGNIGHCIDITERKRMFDILEKRIGALSNPAGLDSVLLFEELFDLEEIQKIQDAFSDAVGVASLICKPDGSPITRPSRFTRFCCDYVRVSETGCLNCMKSAALLGAPNANGPVVQPCLSGGLWDAGAAIIVGNRHIANWLVGQVRNEAQNEERIIQLADEIGINKQELLDAFYEVPSMAAGQFQKVAQLLYMLANKLSANAYQNLQQARLITEQIKSEKKLRDSESQFRNFFENAADAIFVADLDNGIIVDANLAASRLIQLPVEKIIGMHQSQLHPPQVEEYSKQSFVWQQQESLSSGSTIPMENQVVRSNGTLVPVEILASVVTIQGKQCLMGTFRNISERKFMEGAMHESEKRYRNLAESSPYGIALFQDGQFVYVNTSCLKMLGATQTFELIGLPFLSVFRPQSRPEVNEWMKSLLHGDFIRPREEILVRIDGSMFDAEVVPLNSTYNDKPAGQVIFRDITESKLAKEEIYMLNQELEQRVSERTAELEAANKELESFSYSVSHDLRSPLRSIDGFSNILLEDYGTTLDTEARRLLDVIIRNANKMGVLIDDLLEFSRLGRKEINLSAIDMYSMAEMVFEELAAGADRENIDFRLQPIPSAFGDPSLIRQVWFNILSNAVKYTSKKSQRVIEVSSITQNNELIYMVADNGAGFNMEHQAKLFGVFQRLHSPKEFEGTGVGLATVNRIIQRHKGKIWATGIVGEGATFYFSLPVHNR